MVVRAEVRTVGPGVGLVSSGSTELADHHSELWADHPPFLPESVTSVHGLGLSVLLTEPADSPVVQPPWSGVTAAAAGAVRHLVRIKVPEQRVRRQRGIWLGLRHRRNKIQLWRNILRLWRNRLEP